MYLVGNPLGRNVNGVRQLSKLSGPPDKFRVIGLSVFGQPIGRATQGGGRI